MKLRKNKNRRIIKEAMKFYPYDYVYVLLLEKQALIRMREYFTASRITEGNDIIVRDIKVAIGLLDIIVEKDSTYNYSLTGGTTCSNYVNTRNWKRFLDKIPQIEKDLNKAIIKDYLRREKAWCLYNYLRFHKMRLWWD